MIHLGARSEGGVDSGAIGSRMALSPDSLCKSEESFDAAMELDHHPDPYDLALSGTELIIRWVRKQVM